MSAGQSEANDVATLVELHVILLTDFDAIDRVVTRVEGQRQGGLSLHVAGLAEIVYLIEVVGIAGFLCDALQMGLAINLDSHVDIPSFVNLQHAAQPLPICNIIVNQHPQIVEEKGWYFLSACGMIKRIPSNNTGPYPLIELQIRRKPMTFLQSILLGLIQGVAEFLPISSSGHLAIAQNLLHINAEVPAFYDVLLHLGTLVAVFVAYWQDICDMVREFFCGIGDLVHHSTPTPVPPARRLILLIILGTLPLFAILPIKDTVEGLKSSMVFIGAALIVTGFLLFFSDRARKGRKDARSATVLDVLVVGVSQAIATVPGISRSGMTITTGCFVGFERRFAVRFSFLLSIPAVLGANILSLKDALTGGVDWSQLPVYLAGVVVAAVSGYLCIRLLKMIADKGRFGAFAYYCWAAGLATLILNAVK